MDDRSLLLERFHVALVASIDRANPNYLREAFTVGEIYEDLIPYRTHRDLIGVAMNGDYEDGLMRLLAGEGGYLILESAEARRAIVEELSRKAPDTGLFKKFRDAPVRLNPEQLGPRPPASPPVGVARLFEGSPSDEDRSGGVVPKTQNGWELGAPEKTSGRAGGGHEKTGPVDASRPRDEVKTADDFWAERRAREEEEEDGPGPAEPAGRAGRVDHLEAENRRLKILLAERVLEVEELRERLSRGNKGARREKP